MDDHSTATQSKPQSTLSKLKAGEPKFSWRVWLAWFTVITLLFFFIFKNAEHSSYGYDPFFNFWMSPLQGLVGATFYYGGYVALRQWVYRFMLKRVAAETIETRAESLQDDLDKDFFNNLVKINFKYIDKYYLQTQIQADKAFSMSAIAAFIGFSVMIAGIVQMYIGKLEPAYVTTITGVISEFIAAVFFYLYNKTILKMAEYHRKLVLTQNIGLALRITKDLPDEQRWSSQTALVDRLSADINSLVACNAKEA